MIKILQGDCIEQMKSLLDESVHCVVTSPPYWGLRDYGIEGQFGLEKTPEEYVAKMVAVFREVRRVLRPDGTCWLNLGDSFAGSGLGWCKNTDAKQLTSRAWEGRTGRPENYISSRQVNGLKPKDLCGIPWRVAFALQGIATISIDEIAALCKAIDKRDIPALDMFRTGFRLWEEMAGMGWYWNRQDIIWNKLNPMPESVTDRCTKSHEYIFLLTKSAQYYYDAEAIKEEAAYDGRNDTVMKGSPKYADGYVPNQSEQTVHAKGHERWNWENGTAYRNKRSVWTINTAPCKEAHFATFPPDLVRPCIRAGTSERGCCPICGEPWERIVKKSGGTTGKSWHDHSADLEQGMSQKGCSGLSKKNNVEGNEYSVKTIGWRPTCDCPTKPPISCTVLDPFAGAFTTALVAEEEGRNSIMIELNPEYIAIGKKRTQQQGLFCKAGG